MVGNGKRPAPTEAETGHGDLNRLLTFPNEHDDPSGDAGAIAVLEISYSILQGDLARIREAIQQAELSEKLIHIAPEAAKRMLHEAQRVLNEQIAKLVPLRAAQCP